MKWVVVAGISSVLSSVGTVFFGGLVGEVGALHGSGLVYLSSGLMLACLAIVRMREVLGEALRRSAPRLAAFVCVRGILGPILFGLALSLTPSIKVVFFTKIEPYLVMLWSWLFWGSKPDREHILLLGVHIIGAIVLSAGASLHFGKEQWGDLILLAAMSLFALTYPLGKKLTAELPSIFVLTVTNIIGGSTVLAIAAYVEPTPYPLTISATLNLLGAGGIGLTLGITLWLVSLKHMEPWIASALRSLGPLVAAPISWFFFKQHIELDQIIGAFLVLLTSVLIVRVHLSKRAAAA